MLDHHRDARPIPVTLSLSGLRRRSDDTYPWHQTKKKMVDLLYALFYISDHGFSKAHHLLFPFFFSTVGPVSSILPSKNTSGLATRGPYCGIQHLFG
jgi:hypothetical protein